MSQPSQEETLLFEECGKIIKSRTNFYRHQTELQRATTTEFSCAICDRRFLYKSILKRRSINSHGIPEQRFSKVSKLSHENISEIKPSKPWNPPFEVKFRIKPAPILPIIFKRGFYKLTVAAALKVVGSESDPNPTTEELMEDLEFSHNPTPSSSTATICMDETPQGTSTSNVYGVFKKDYLFIYLFDSCLTSR